RTESNSWIAAEVVGARSRYVGIIGVLRDPGQEAVRQRRRPGLAAIEGGIHAAAVVVIQSLLPVIRLFGSRGFTAIGVSFCAVVSRLTFTTIAGAPPPLPLRLG